MAEAAGRRVMQLALPGQPHLTYCTNIHAGERWHEIFAALREFLPSVKGRVSPSARMGVGLRLSAVAADDLNEPGELGELEAFLLAEGLYVFTVNAFPFGAFHGTRVKERVYEPDWRDTERLRFTNRVADILAKLLPAGVNGSISTVPGAHKSKVRGPDDVARMAEAMVWHAAHLHAIARETGQSIVLALEPEPCCFLETTAEAIAFFEQHLFAATAIETFARLTQTNPQQARRALRRHLGICLDVCHAAVEFEDVTQSVRQIDTAGICVAKIQLSSALRLPAVAADAQELLSPFDDGVYLHQTVEDRHGRLTRYADLPDAFAALRRGDAGGEWRVHCHVPLFQRSYGALNTTQEPVAELLAACRQRALTTHLEVETYTWGLLPRHMRDGDVSTDVARELTWVRSQLNA